jgi:phosphatidylethanolamine/phosphatidyl-N-methylethanolamine N-methyltransferase
LLDKNRNPFAPRKLKLDLKKFDLKALDAKGQELREDIKRLEEKLDAKGRELKEDLRKFEEKLDAKGRELKDDLKKLEERLKSKALDTLAKAKSRSPKKPTSATGRKKNSLGDDAKFLMNWIESPLKTGSIIPSSKELAKGMVDAVDFTRSGLIIELGPGTGPVTQELLDRGIDPSRLVLVEYSADFVKLLRERFRGVTVIQGDAYNLGKTLAAYVGGPIAAIVSSLPLLTRPDEERARLLRDALAMMDTGCPFIQFTYGNTSPVPLDGSFESGVSRRIWKNIPPARVWTYRALP